MAAFGRSQDMAGFVTLGSSSFVGPRSAVPKVTSMRRRTQRWNVSRSCRASLVEKITGEQLDKELQTEELPMLVDFYATWCGPCQFMMPELEKIADEYKGKVRVMKIDSEEDANLSSLLQVRGLPTLFFIKDSQILFRFEGALMKDDLAYAIDQVFFGKKPEEVPDSVAEAPTKD